MKKILALYRALGRREKIAVWLGGIMLFYTVVGFLIAPPIVRMVLEKKLPELLHRPVTIETVRLNPYTLSATLEKLRIERKDGSAALFAFDRLYVNLESLSLVKRALVIKSIALEGPTIDVTRIEGDRFNFSDLLESDAAPAQKPSEPDKPFLFSINNIEISRGDIRFADLPKETAHHIRDLTIAIPSVSNLPVDVQTTVEPRFSAIVNDTPLELTGGSKPFAESKATELVLKMTGIDLPEYLAYIPNPTGLTLGSALLDLDIVLSYQLTGGGSRLSLTGNVGLRNVEVVDADGHSYLSLPTVALQFADSNLLERQVHLAEIRIDTPRVELIRSARGELLPLALLAPPAEAAPAAEAPAAEADTGETAGPAPVVTVDRFRLNGGHIGFDDRMLADPARLVIDNIIVNADDLTTAADQSGKLAVSMALNDSGAFNLDGSLGLTPLTLTAGIDLQKLALQGFQPYVAEQARVVVGGGDLSLKGDLEFADSGTPLVRFRGDASVTGLKAVDAESGADLLRWRALDLQGIRYTSSPPALSMADLNLRSPYLQVLINRDGRINLASLVKETPKAEAQPAAETAAAGPPLQVAINLVRLTKGEIAFQDRNIEPNYGFRVDQLQGAINGLSSDPATRADVNFTARVDQQAPLAISGQLNPLSREPFANIALGFKDFNLPPLSPYTGKYAGYKTDKGKLQLDLAYRVEGNHLDSSNKVFLDQFTLGEAVDSPDATSLPVGLAIALLKNRAGEIDLDIPVKGDLDDPEFSVAGVVVQVVVNLIAKAATSPFALLGALIPAGEDIEYIPFDPGSSELNEAAIGKLAVVANVLQERPGLKMDLAGHADPELDRQALARLQLARLVALEKAKKTGVEARERETVAVGAEEYPDYLRRAYSKVLKEAPKGVREAQKALESNDPVAELKRMEDYLLSTIVIGDSELRLLAIDRANRVLSHLVDVGKVEAERLFAVEPRLETTEEKTPSPNMAAVQLIIR